MMENYQRKIIDLREIKKEKLEKMIIDFVFKGLSDKVLKEFDYSDFAKKYGFLIDAICEDYGIDYDNPDLNKAEESLYLEEHYCNIFLD